MGSCYSTSKVVRGKKKDSVELDSNNAGPAKSDGGFEETGPKTPPSTSPPKSRSRRHRQRHGSGRWRRKRSSGDESMFWGSDGVEIPGRMCSNGASKIACLYTQQGKKGTNQDAMIVWENFSSREDTVFCGVFDGHGPYGHLVARKIRDSLPLILSTQWKGNPNGSNFDETGSQSMDEEWCEASEEPEREKLPEMYGKLKQSILTAFRLMDKDLKLHPTIDCFCSGSTAVTLVKQGQHIVIGNVGDSRAVLATRDNDESLVARQLTVDLKPDLPREAARIHQCKGRVFALQDEPEVARVWLPNSDSPGLAMARAFGDFCLKDFGLISVPDVYYHKLSERDEFVVLATDGVWDVLSNKEVIEIVASAPGRTNAARALVDCAVRAWRLKYPTSKNDDCAAVCLFLENCDEASDESVKILETDRSQATILELSGDKESTLGGSNEIVPAPEPTESDKEKLPVNKSPSKRSLAEFISTADDDEEWSALEGVTRVNSLLSLPRFLSGDKRSASWRKWL